MTRLLSSLFALFILIAPSTRSETIYLRDKGLNQNLSPSDAFNIISATHEEAVMSNSSLSYQGIDKISIEIPKNAKSIPLPQTVDFANVELVVINTSKDMFLFKHSNQTNKTRIKSFDSEKINFSNVEELHDGLKLIIIEDQKPWVENRIGYNYPFFRKDIILIENGIPQNTPITQYSLTDQINLSFVRVTDQLKSFKNLTFIRSDKSTFKTYLFNIENENNILLKGISIETPDSPLFGDIAITISNCTNVHCDSIMINGTYSQVDKYGYGFYMNNVWNSKFSNLETDSKWGIFGNNNINTAKINESSINRFDIHCYGKDVSCTNTTFNNLYNSFSSIFGYVRFVNCIFNHSIPVLLGSSYNSYTPFNIEIKNCEIIVDYKRPYIIQVKFQNREQYKMREELSCPKLPNIEANGLKINTFKNNQFFIYGFIGDIIPPLSSSPIVNLSKVELDSSVKLLTSNKYNEIFSEQNVQ